MATPIIASSESTRATATLTSIAQTRKQRRAIAKNVVKDILRAPCLKAVNRGAADWGIVNSMAFAGPVLIIVGQSAFAMWDVAKNEHIKGRYIRPTQIHIIPELQNYKKINLPRFCHPKTAAVWEDKRLALIDLIIGKITHRIASNTVKDCIQDVHFFSHNTIMMVTRKSLNLFDNRCTQDAPTPRTLMSHLHKDDGIQEDWSAASCNIDHNTLAVASTAGKLFLYDIRNLSKNFHLITLDNPAHYLSSDGKHLYACGVDVSQINIVTGEGKLRVFFDDGPEQMFLRYTNQCGSGIIREEDDGLGVYDLEWYDGTCRRWDRICADMYIKQPNVLGFSNLTANASGSQIACNEPLNCVVAIHGLPTDGLL
eukprot:gene7243-7655_t